VNKKILVLGGGVAGASMAYYLTEKGYDVTLIEKNTKVGGLARTCYYSGHPYEFGPHIWFWPGGKEAPINATVVKLTNDELCDLMDGEVFERRVVDAGETPLHREEVQIDEVVDVNVRPDLCAAEHRDHARRERRHRECVHGEIETHTRRHPADGRGPEDRHRHPIRVAQEDALGNHLRLVVVGDGHQVEIFRDVGLRTDTVHRPGRWKDDLLHTRARRLVHQPHRPQDVHVPGCVWVQIGRRIVRDARQMEDRIDAAEIDRGGMA